MNSKLYLPHRRQMIRGVAAGVGVMGGGLIGFSGNSNASNLASLFWNRPGVFAEELTLTPALNEGPFYPDRLPLDTDNDLLIITDSITPAVGEVTHLTGRILGKTGEPVRGALVEIWQVDNHGSYLHSRGANSENDNQRDSNFQGYGRFLTDQKGQYYFRTIKPVAYPDRTPHIHFAVTVGDKKMLSTQMMINGHPGNAEDVLLSEIKDEKLRGMLVVDFNKVEGSRIGELAANFDLVIGHTPEDSD